MDGGGASSRRVNSALANRVATVEPVGRRLLRQQAVLVPDKDYSQSLIMAPRRRYVDYALNEVEQDMNKSGTYTQRAC